MKRIKNMNFIYGIKKYGLNLLRQKEKWNSAHCTAKVDWLMYTEKERTKE